MTASAQKAMEDHSKSTKGHAGLQQEKRRPCRIKTRENDREQSSLE